MNKLLLAGAVSAALFAGHASAAVVLKANGTVDIAATQAAGSIDEIWVAGSSAMTPVLQNAVLADCVSGTAYKYQDSAASAFTWICDSSLAAGTVNIVHKRDGGGSIGGYKAALGINQNFNDDASLDTATACSTVSTISVPLSSGTVTYTLNGCTGATVTQSAQPSTFNMADVDGAQFESALNGGLAGASTASSDTVAAQGFGIVVNLKLRNAMQQAMINSGVLPGTCTVGDETEACMANLSTEQVSSLFASGRVTDWNNLRYGNTATAQSLFAATAIASRPGNRDVHICSRTAGSGTLATMQAVFENAPCYNNSEAIQAAGSQTISNESGANGGTKIYHSMSGSGDVENCLEGLDQGSTKGTFTYPTLVQSGTNTFRWAIGIMGTERNASNAKNYRFIKIDGYAPSNKNIVEGKYKFWAELQRPYATGTTVTDALALDIIKNLNSADQLQAVDPVHTNFGQAGFLAHANSTTFAPTFNNIINTLTNAAYDASRPVNPWSRSLAGGTSVNHCRVPTIPGGNRAMPSFKN